MTKPCIALIIALLALTFAFPVMASAPSPNEGQDADHARRTELFGAKYQTALNALRNEASPEGKAALEKLSDEELLTIAHFIEKRYRTEMEASLATKVERAEESVPSLFYGMIAFAIAMLALTGFAAFKAKGQAAKLAELEARLGQGSRDD
ncbi:MAG: hypothetical protein KDB07_11105 [Planctomycetes bacterium]|nr:hypothetical protein [Planctomycetota bacterium]